MSAVALLGRGCVGGSFIWLLSVFVSRVRACVEQAHGMPVEQRVLFGLVAASRVVPLRRGCADSRKGGERFEVLLLTGVPTVDSLV